MPNIHAGERPRLRAFQLYVPPAAAALAMLDRRCCRWPIGEIDHDGFRFCGAPCDGGPYCRTHGRLAVRKGRQ